MFQEPMDAVRLFRVRLLRSCAGAGRRGMNIMRVRHCAALALGILVMATPGFAQGAPKAPRGQVASLIVGTWRMAGVETRVYERSVATDWQTLISTPRRSRA